MPSAAPTSIEHCQVRIYGQTRRGIRAVCGNPSCSTIGTLTANTLKTGRGADEEVEWKLMAHKFEKLGWKIGRNPNQNRCPRCYSAIRSAQIRKHSKPHIEELAMNNKVIQMTTTALTSQTVEPPRGERPMSRDERRLITERMLEVYANETVGYREDWSDDKVAEDMGVPRIWVAQVRDEAFGPEDKNEFSVNVVDEGKALLAEMNVVRKDTDALQDQLVLRMHDLLVRADQLEAKLNKLMERRK